MTRIFTAALAVLLAALKRGSSPGRGTMVRYGGETREFHYDPKRLSNYLDQLGIKFPTLAKQRCVPCGSASFIYSKSSCSSSVYLSVHKQFSPNR
jgi:hypothetical protein